MMALVMVVGVFLGFGACTQRALRLATLHHFEAIPLMRFQSGRPNPPWPEVEVDIPPSPGELARREKLEWHRSSYIRYMRDAKLYGRLMSAEPLVVAIMLVLIPWIRFWRQYGRITG